jgi:primosomal protein N' (replication factor Y)
VEAALAELRRTATPARVLRVLARSGSLDVQWLYAQTGATLADLRRLESYDLIYLGEKTVWRESVESDDIQPAQPPALTPEQAAAWNTLREAVQRARDPDTPAKARTFLLHGVTGSGKTELYLRAIEACLVQKRGALLLVPEIALTPQTVRRVAARFNPQYPGRVAVVHSGISENERYDTWRRARDGLVSVVVGARSALFTPLPDIGVIILDEEHETSYKQSPPIPPPYYHARAVAEAIAARHGAVVILGSATPSIETAYRAANGDIGRIELPSRITTSQRSKLRKPATSPLGPRARSDDDADALHIDLPPVQIVDMRAELKAGNTSIFSHALHDALDQVLARREQAILFLNRRGQATYVFCRDCGYTVKCPRCETPLTYHRHGQALRCHRCGHLESEPHTCPQCTSRRIKFFGAGTQQVEQALLHAFPTARVLRWDADTAGSQEAHDLILTRFSRRQADVLVGTQMIAKGLDLPLVTLVGAVSADVSLGLPDFRAGERTFQLLTQVAGRAGRGLLGGRVILQTYQPENDVITSAARHDYAAFYAREIARRRELGYPPYRRLARILIRANSETRAQQEAEHAASLLRHRLRVLGMSGTSLIGPAPCFFGKENDLYRWHVLLRGPDPTPALRGLDVRKGWYIDLDPIDIL